MAQLLPIFTYMDTNTFVLYGNVTTVYDQLLGFCGVNGFKVKEPTMKYHGITAKKTSLLFWRNLQMQLTIMATEKKNVEVAVMIYKYGKRKPELEKEYRIAIEHFFSSSQ
jgi:hypothetical protein